MTRDAKLYILRDKDYKPLVAQILNSANHQLQNDIVIYQLSNSSSNSRYYAILSLSDDADTVLKDFGATLSSEKDTLKTTLHNYHGDTLFGDKSNIVFLNKI